MKGVERPSRPTTWRFPLSHPKKGAVVVMDNLQAHKSSTRVRELIGGARAGVLFLSTLEAAWIGC